jgi:hypothetical protein
LPFVAVFAAFGSAFFPEYSQSLPAGQTLSLRIESEERSPAARIMRRNFRLSNGFA